MSYQVGLVQLYPTELLRFDVGSEFDPADTQTMIDDIDSMVKNKLHLQIDDRTPQYQSYPMLFNQNVIPGKHWAKLADTFSRCCWLYTQNIKNICNNQDNLTLAGVRGWFYKRVQGTENADKLPWHSHYPAFLSGIFYLRVPPDPNDRGGTQFADPRSALCSRPRDVFVSPVEMSWLIFPSWLSHRTDPSPNPDPRYVIAADCYVSVRG